ncbi:MAG: restriction endonuclease subunit S [Chloroflexi bacterium]|nr:restriction endonuclease subunit S [Chloroflexota bacterium]
MAADWQEVTVADIASAGRNALVGGPFGSDLVSRDYVDHGVPVIRGQNMGGRWVAGDCAFVTPEKAASLAANTARAGDIVFTQRGTLGQVCLVPDAPFDRYLVSQSQMKLTVNRELADPLFFYYVFRDIEQQDYIRRNSIQTGVPHTNLGILRATPVPLPPIAEQRAIAHILGTLDDKIELNRRMTETLEAIARALFKSWFVDFDPVRAKSEGRDPGLPPHLADLFPDSFEDSELGEIPAEWRAGPIYDIADFVYGAPFASAKFNTEHIGVPLIRIRDLTTETPAVWTQEVHPKGHLVRPGDIVVGMDGEFRAHLWGGAQAWLNQRVCVAVPKPGYSAAFVHSSLTEPLRRVEATETATTVIHLGKYDIDRFAVVVPTHAVVGAFNRTCQVMNDRIVASKAQSRALAALRDALLPRLISGALRVKDAERITEVA